MTLAEAVQRAKRDYLARLLERHKPADVARIAGVNRTHLYRMAHRLGLECGKPRGNAMTRPVPPIVDDVAKRFAVRLVSHAQR